jgi:heptosyltransferase-2/heptosyltransferase-3
MKQGLRLFLLRLLARLVVRQRPRSAHEPRRILLIRPDHLGDVLFTTPALAQLRASLPGAHITYLCGPWSRDLLAHNPHLDQVLTCDFPWFNRRAKGPPWQPYQVLWREAGRLRREGFDAAIILRFDFWWGALLAALAGIPRRIGYDVAECRPFLTEAAPYVGGRHEVEQNLRLVEVLKEPGKRQSVEPSSPGTPKLESYPTEADHTHARNLLASRGIADGQSVICIQVGAGAAVKLWAAERWAAVADLLAEGWNAQVVLTGSTGERSLAQDIATRMRHPATILAGETNLGQLAALFARCTLVLGVDSGPLHLAVAMDTPTVHLYGPVDPAAFGPWGDPERHGVVQAHYFDQLCHGRPCNRLDYAPAELPEHGCLATISVEEVVAAAELTREA